ncbi:MAG: hypothetical protein JW928_00945 [Candidatus Aureabacteria bacterium]|nr:hypothetical protein [Candidatus Auribacterota bacterium]
MRVIESSGEAMPFNIFSDTPEKRIQRLTEDIEKNPKDYRAYIDRGWAWHEKGEVEKAKADMEKAREIMAGR